MLMVVRIAVGVDGLDQRFPASVCVRNVLIMMQS